MNIPISKMFPLTKGKDTTKKNWRKSTNIDGIDKEVFVKELENGFLIRLTKSGEFPSKIKGRDTDYKYFEKEYMSKTNPFEKGIDPREKKVRDMDDLFLDSIDI